MTNKKFGLALFTGLLLFSACQHDQTFQEYKSLDDYSWAYQDTLAFEVPVQDTTSAYALSLNLRNKINYPYRNIWVLISHKAPSGKVSTIKAEFELATKEGKWKGQGLGDLYDHRFPVKNHIRLSETGKHQFYVTHLMRTDTLQGLMNLGLSLNKVQS